MSNQSPKAYTPPRRGHTGPVRSLIAGLTTIKSTHNNLTNRPEGQGTETLICQTKARRHILHLGEGTRALYVLSSLG
ncbi:hypothetical protein JTE90_000492 [Oedothorax gibbosus]|uniref:Uncharacterized protein n=1 Tax=Oedothorax gibbosus TaxID=931172 RepID=A0AAV6TKH3_9ARAC|nr:hypothetical protein JTE90_008353 [Oedothorax gibbosus]KAG8171149.1 hypothetical protein JTE90_023927 [Oedothorax gibbosus]KAG8172307.1 hypothetical protein JTE90_000492 [Oedothorax gibbosus]